MKMTNFLVLKTSFKTNKNDKTFFFLSKNARIGDQKDKGNPKKEKLLLWKSPSEKIGVRRFYKRKVKYFRKLIKTHKNLNGEWNDG